MIPSDFVVATTGWECISLHEQFWQTIFHIQTYNGSPNLTKLNQTEPNRPNRREPHLNKEQRNGRKFVLRLDVMMCDGGSFGSGGGSDGYGVVVATVGMACKIGHVFLKRKQPTLPPSTAPNGLESPLFNIAKVLYEYVPHSPTPGLHLLAKNHVWLNIFLYFFLIFFLLWCLYNLCKMFYYYCNLLGKHGSSCRAIARASAIVIAGERPTILMYF